MFEFEDAANSVEAQPSLRVVQFQIKALINGSEFQTEPLPNLLLQHHKSLRPPSQVALSDFVRIALPAVDNLRNLFLTPTKEMLNSLQQLTSVSMQTARLQVTFKTEPICSWPFL